jgi:two-component system phosphate regulon sensor histidine kinase PhoR
LIFAGALIGFLIGFFYFRRASRENTGTDKNQNTNPARLPQTLLAKLTGGMREGVIIVGEDLRVSGANLAAAAIFPQAAVSPASIETKRLTDLTRNLSVHDAFKNALKHGERAEIKFETRGEEKRVFDLHIAPLEFEDTSERNAIGVFFDITQLEKLENVRQEFLSNVSHELRTPLTSIIAFVETLEDGALEDPENNRRFLGVIRKNAERMHRLINDILELSAIESGRITIEPQTVRLAALVEEIKNNLESKAKPRGVRIENKIDPEISVYADRFRLEQMLTNLMDNAVKFNRENGSVEVGFERNDGRDLICVRDTGEGLLPDQTDRVFERFYRVDRARSREIGGTGLGLAIVKHLARLHGGEVSVDSKLGEGTAFTIELPSLTDKG